jgi:hypothetical protein
MSRGWPAERERELGRTCTLHAARRQPAAVPSSPRTVVTDESWLASANVAPDGDHRTLQPRHPPDKSICRAHALIILTGGFESICTAKQTLP